MWAITINDDYTDNVVVKLYDMNNDKYYTFRVHIGDKLTDKELKKGSHYVHLKISKLGIKHDLCWHESNKQALQLWQQLIHNLPSFNTSDAVKDAMIGLEELAEEAISLHTG